MTQRYTIELERVNVYCATLEIEADNLLEAKTKAIIRVTAVPDHWQANVGPARVVKVIAHAKETSNDRI